MSKTGYKNSEQVFDGLEIKEVIGRLAGGVAHEFNNLLGIIIANAELAETNINAQGSIDQNLQEIIKAGHRAARTVRRLLTFSGRQFVNLRAVDSNDMVSGYIRKLVRLLGDDVCLRFVPGKKIWRIRMDPSQFQDILTALVCNSRDAMPGGGRVTIRTENKILDETFCGKHDGAQPGSYVLFAVSDTGEGMSEEIVRHLFEPFFTTKEVGKGIGLGLPMVYGAVKQNNGYIQVYSEPGKGTTVKLYIPRWEEQNLKSDRQALGRHVSTGMETVLVTESDDALLEACRCALERQGYSVLVACNPTEALDLAEGHSGEIDLLLTDLKVWEKKGGEFGDKFRVLRPTTRRLFTADDAGIVAKHEDTDQGANVIEKPFTFTGLVENVRKVLDK